MPTPTLRLLESSGASVTIATGKNEQLRLSFPQSSASVVPVSAGNASLIVSTNVTVVITQVNNEIQIVFSQPTVVSTGIVLQLENLNNFQGGGQSYTGYTGKSNINISLFSIIGSAARNNLICFTLNSVEAKIIIQAEYVMQMKYGINQSEQVVSALSEPNYPTAINVRAGQRPPEFSLGIFDDAAFTIPRPIRFGNVVCSTVPAEPISGASTLSGVDATNYALGQGTQYRTMYFRAVCNQVLPVQSVELQVYMPMGTDTISGTPISLTLYTSAWAGDTNVLGRDFRGNSLLPSGNSIFQVENTVNAVDGICVFNIFLPLYCQVSLPLRLEVTTNGLPINNWQTFENPNLF